MSVRDGTADRIQRKGEEHTVCRRGLEGVKRKSGAGMEPQKETQAKELKESTCAVATGRKGFEKEVAGWREKSRKSPIHVMC